MELKEKRILITGGCGFIGSQLAEQLSKENEVKIIDDLSSGTLTNIGGIKDKVICAKRDIRERGIETEFNDIDVVFHEAAQAFISTSLENPLFDADVNILGTLNILEACRKKDVPRVVFASSSAVYGEPQTIPLKETHPLNPVTPYGLAKKVCEEYLRLYYSLYRIESIALRYFNVYGKNQNLVFPNAGVIALFTDRLVKGEPVTIYGDESCTRDFIHVEDVAKANILAALCRQASATVINVGTGRETSIKDVIRILEELTHRTIKVMHLPERKGDITRSVADITASKKILGFEPRINLEEGLARLFREVSA